MTPTGNQGTKGYNATFWYPKEGGIGRLVRGLRTGLGGCAVNHEVVSLNLRDRTLRVKTGETFCWDQMFSSIPLQSLCQMTTDDDLVRLSAGLSCSSTVSFNIGLQGQLPPEFHGIHWIYIPDRGIPFYRVGFYSNIGIGTCTPGYSSLYVEVGLSAGTLYKGDLIRELQPRVMQSLRELGWLRGCEIASIVVHFIEHAYVHHTPRRDAAVEAIRARLQTAGIHPIGRYGLWDYTSMEDSMESARSAVLEVESCNAA